MTTNEGRTAYSIDIDTGATPEQTAAIQRLFDDIGLEATISATYTVKSPIVVAVMYLIGSGVATAFLKGVPVVIAEKTTNIADLRGCGLDR